MQRQVLTTLLCSLALCSAVASAADIKPRGTRGRPAEVIVELTEAGKKLAAKYAEQLGTLKAEIEAALPQIDDAGKAALLKAFEAEAAPAAEVRAKAESVAKWRAVDDKLRNLEEQLKYAPQMVAEKSKLLIGHGSLVVGQNDQRGIFGRAVVGKRPKVTVHERHGVVVPVRIRRPEGSLLAPFKQCD